MCHDFATYSCARGNVSETEPAGRGRRDVVIAAITAVVGAVATIVAALIGHAQGKSEAAPAPTVTATTTVTARPSATVTESGGASPAGGGSAGNSAGSARLLAPVSQVGWTLVWSGRKSIGPQGILFSSSSPNSGPKTGTGNGSDIQYLGPGSGWNSGLNHFYYWTNSYRPGPATITGLLQSNNFSGENPQGMRPQVGDRLYVAMDTEAEGFNIVAYMQVLSVGQESVTVDMWLWNSASS
jgi:hypothetical protein